MSAIIEESMSFNKKNKAAIYSKKISTIIDFISQNKFEEAEKEAREATKLNQKDSVAYSYLAAALAYQSKFEEAEKEAREAIKLDPENAEAHENLARILFS